jgi:sulfite reductase (NADPH) hemoprotein beta-component
MEAIMRVYNQIGRRDNKYKARIKILVHETGAEEFAKLVEDEWERIKDGNYDLLPEEMARIEACFQPPPYQEADDAPAEFEDLQARDPEFSRWVLTNLAPHKRPGYAIVNLSLKPEGGIPGDATADQMDAVADLAERFSFGEIRVTHEQNLVLADVMKADLPTLWRELKVLELATPNISLVTDIICCPGLDYCGLATARSIPVAQRISKRFADLTLQNNIGELRLKISGCINACGHHHVGHIGILGLDRKGEEYYQITLGGHAGEDLSIGKVIGPSFSEEAIVDAVATIVNTYVDLRDGDEKFIDTYRRVGEDPFKENLYAAH